MKQLFLFFTLIIGITINLYAQGEEIYYNLSVISDPFGSVDPSSGSYLEGTPVMITPTPNDGYHFAGWGGDESGSGNPLNIIMDSDKLIYAYFEINEYLLTVNSSAGGWVDQSPSGSSIEYGTPVTLTAIEMEGYHFTGWSGDYSGTEYTITFTMDRDINVFANFEINTYNLYTYADNGSISLNPDQPNYTHGSLVELTATPSYGYHFVEWSGDATGSANPLSLEMNSEKNVTAIFAINKYTLNITADHGSVERVPDQLEYEHGTGVQLNAVPEAGYHFTGWSDDESGSDNPLTVTMNDNMDITANFAIDSYTLNIIAENGTVLLNPEQANYDYGTTVDLTPVPSDGYHFVEWTGDAAGTSNPLSLTMDGNKSVTAVFAINTYTLNLSAVNGSVTKDPDQSEYDHGAGVQLNAIPEAGYHFTGWSGDESGSDNPLSITMNNNKNITANFSIDSYTLIITMENGLVVRNPDLTGYDYGSNVELTAVPSEGYHFAGWTGDATGTSNPLSILMDGNKEITAVFEINMYTLNIEAVNGSVTPVPALPEYDHGLTVELFPEAAEGYEFDRWSGDAHGSDNPFIITMDGNKNVTAEFKLYAHHMLISTISGSTNNSPLNSFTVTVKDYFGNNFTSYEEPVSLAAGSIFEPDSYLFGTLEKTPVDGVATFSTGGVDFVQVNQDIDAGGYFTIYALSGSLREVESNQFTLGVLPVELTAFEVSADNSNTRLRWITSTEVNNYGFEVERQVGSPKDPADMQSAVGNQNNPNSEIRNLKWEIVGFVQGSGNSNSPKEYCFVDEKPVNGKNIYRLKQIDNDGTIAYSSEIEIEFTEIPVDFALFNNYPNPANPATTIKFGLPVRCYVNVEVYNTLGERIALLADETKDAGFHEVRWDGSNVSSGIYFYTIRAKEEGGSKEFKTVKKMLIMK